MSSRRRSRETALQMIFQWEQSRSTPEEVMAAYWGGLSNEGAGQGETADPFANHLLQGVVGRCPAIDELIRKHAEHWRMERMSAVDRNILRLAVFELLEKTAAPAVVIDEALEVGRRYSGDESAPFLNGILDAVEKSLGAEHGKAVESQATNS
jgi:N utilization substance protein B